MTQMESARKGQITAEMKAVAARERVEVEYIRQGVAEGSIVIPANQRHAGLISCGIGKGLATKVNANIGTSLDLNDLQAELDKLQVALDCKVDAIMDLSTGGDIPAVRRAILASCPVPVGTVPAYQAFIEALDQRGAMVRMTAEDLFAAIETQMRDGVDFITVHCGITRSTINRIKKQTRVTDVVSRGGAFLAGWMIHNERENPLYEQYDRLLALAREYDVTLSLGDGMRPGCIADATDLIQIDELLTLGELVQRARDAGVQVMVEGPGHVPLDQIETNIKVQKSICKGAPFYVLGPLVTDVAAGYDHITAAIGGAVAGACGADFLCYVTPAEHLSLPDKEDVRQGIMASRIAAHAADIAKNVKGAREWDLRIAQARKRLNWEEQADLSIDPALARRVHSRQVSNGKACTMCGGFCAMETVARYLGTPVPRC